MEAEFSKTFEIKNKLGLHARAAAQFVRLSSKFNSNITIKKDGYTVDGKSILGVLSLAAVKGTKIEVIADGNDSEQAFGEIEQLIECGFGEGIDIS
ncbi:MAG: HPr family phosphocarrier protein [Thermodesulfobacteriota bacterium]